MVGIAYLLAFESANNLAMSPAENIEYDRWVPHVRGAGAARAVISVAKIGPGKVGRTCRACSRMCGSGQRPICSKFFKSEKWDIGSIRYTAIQLWLSDLYELQV
ncbi:unnamed protein product [Camellia sinensis]